MPRAPWHGMVSLFGGRCGASGLADDQPGAARHELRAVVSQEQRHACACGRDPKKVALQPEKQCEIGDSERAACRDSCEDSHSRVAGGAGSGSTAKSWLGRAAAAGLQTDPSLGTWRQHQLNSSLPPSPNPRPEHPLHPSPLPANIRSRRCVAPISVPTSQHSARGLICFEASILINTEFIHLERRAAVGSSSDPPTRQLFFCRTPILMRVFTLLNGLSLLDESAGVKSPGML